MTEPSYTDEHHFAQRTKRALPCEGDLVITREAPMGEVCMVPAGLRCCLGQRMVLLRPNRRVVDPRFLLYALQSETVQREIHVNEGTGSTVSNLRIPLLESLLIPAPPLREQQNIGSTLMALDDKIELNRRKSETLEAMARALFKSWFVDFDPVNAKAEGRDSGLPSATAALFPDRFVDSEVGEIPDEWEVSTLAAVSGLNAESWSKANYPLQIQYLDLSNVKWGRVEQVTQFEKAEAPSRAQRVLRPGDTIVGTVRPGNGSYALVHDDGLTGSTGFAVMRPRDTWLTEFVYLAATAPTNIEALSHLADGGAYPAVRPEVVAATPIVRPSDRVIRAFSGVTSPLLKRISACERESRTLAALRDTLLPKLISGELRVGAPVASDTE